MELLYRRWETPQSTFGDFAVLCFLIVQYLDGAFTYLGVHAWGPGIEANPIVASAMTVAGVGGGVTMVKLVAIAFGVLLHLRRVHNLVAALTLVYLAAAILPWTALFLAI